MKDFFMYNRLLQTTTQLYRGSMEDITRQRQDINLFLSGKTVFYERESVSSE